MSIHDEITQAIQIEEAEENRRADVLREQLRQHISEDEALSLGLKYGMDRFGPFAQTRYDAVVLRIRIDKWERTPPADWIPRDWVVERTTHYHDGHNETTTERGIALFSLRAYIVAAIAGETARVQRET